MADAGWRSAALLAGGGLAAFLVMLGAILAVEDLVPGTDGDGLVLPPLALISIALLAWAWRRRMRDAMWAGAGAAAVLVLFLLLNWELTLLAAAFLLAAAVAVAWRAPAGVRLVAGLPFVWAVALLTALMTQADDAFGPVSGLALAAIGLAYPVAWALNEPVRWARHTAWGAALAWSFLAAGYALMDLAVFADPLTVLTAVLLVLVVLGIAVSWPLHSRVAMAKASGPGGT